ncbi:MAG TPA: hypothetical protein VL086_16995 [Candidatus Nitrosotalea sp.]|jgi:uncharacterized protein YggT (Ycf19 family)|nr:hypothetical protein [Candidatus Nitrosotalea sp.]
MHELIYRFLVLVWFLSYMAAIYLALHMIVARVTQAPDNRVLWFFSVITGPLTRPARAWAPPGTSEARVRLITLIVLVAMWLGTRVLLGAMGGLDVG